LGQARFFFHAAALPRRFRFSSSIWRGASFLVSSRPKDLSDPFLPDFCFDVAHFFSPLASRGVFFLSITFSSSSHETVGLFNPTYVGSSQSALLCNSALCKGTSTYVGTFSSFFFIISLSSYSFLFDFSPPGLLSCALAVFPVKKGTIYFPQAFSLFFDVG